VGKDLVNAMAWRKDVEKRYLGSSIFVKNPLRGKSLCDMKNRIFKPREIVLRDLNDIDQSDLVLANIPKKRYSLMWGSPCEIMYAFLKNIPVIVVTDDEEVRVHYWLVHQCVAFFDNLEESLEYIEKFWFV